MRNIFFIVISVLWFSLSSAQEAYKFTDVIDLEATPVISQGRTGTCWSFSTTSFLESEIIRLTGEKIDLSEMYNVRNTYPQKAENYVMRQGKAQFSEGGLAHDVINSVRDFGLVPLSAYTGLSDGETAHNHAEMVAVINSMLDTYIENPGRKLSDKWSLGIDAVLDVYLGENVTSFTYEGEIFTPKSFLRKTKIAPDDYVNITSFSHSKFYNKFILNIPDNFSNGSFYNLPVDEMINSIDNALENGFTIELDCDVSEPTFSSKYGVAVIPDESENSEAALSNIYPEKNITQAYRQQEFENYRTTDDHLMHITGTVKDQNGNIYYKVKNSWGTNPSRTTNGGYVYFSKSYMALKAISITVHKDAISKSMADQLDL
ncbi:MAG: aminopeptidase [Cytophagales bacterium]|nr:aminopeptidase [Cytophagales bacterium]